MGRAAAGPQLADDRPILFLHTLPAAHQVRDRRGFPGQGAPREAIQPYNYSPNNIDTVYPEPGFRSLEAGAAGADAGLGGATHPSAAEAAVFTDAEDSHAGPTELLAVRSLKDAASAIDTICDQGEGYPVPAIGPDPDDDPSKDEESHYVKFLNLQAQFADYAGCSEQLPPEPPPPAADRARRSPPSELVAAGVLVRLPDNPVNADYPAELSARSPSSAAACFQYMLIMTETIYRVPPDRAEIVLQRRPAPLDDLGDGQIYPDDPQIPIPLGAYAGKLMGPTFENVDLGPARSISFAGPDRARQRRRSTRPMLIAASTIPTVAWRAPIDERRRSIMSAWR